MQHKPTRDTDPFEPDWDVWDGLDCERFESKPASRPKPWRILVEGAPTTVGIATLGVAFFYVFGQLAPERSGASAIGAFSALAMLLGAIHGHHKCRDP